MGQEGRLRLVSNLFACNHQPILIALSIFSVSSCSVFPRTNIAKNMVPVEAVVEGVSQTTNVLAQFSQVLAAESDFGGYVGPAGSLIFIGAMIVTLAPPLSTGEDVTPYNKL